MAITAKPKQTSTPGVDVDALINRGGSVAAPEKTKNEDLSETVQKVLLRVPGDILKSMDAQIKARRVPTSRNQWILEAIVAQVEKDGQ